MVEHIYKNIYRIPITLPNSPLRELNSYVILGEERSLVIDTGFCLPECKAAMEAGLQELGLVREKLDIFLTHRHSDHVGLAGWLAVPGTKICIGENDCYFHRIPGGAIDKDGKYAELLSFGFPMDMAELLSYTRSYLGDVVTPREENLVLLKDGDRVAVDGYELTCMETPGHTPGHMCLWEPRERILFSGDHVLFDITPNVDAWSLPNLDLDQYIESLKRIDSLEPVLVLPGHRKSGELHGRIAALIRHHDDRLAECLQVIRDNPELTAYEVARRLRWKFREKNWDMASPMQRWFATGECIAHIGYLMERDAVAARKDGDGLYRFRAPDAEG